MSTTLPAAPAWAQVRLPALGESASDEFNVSAERRLGEQIMRDIRRDPDFGDDPQLLDYVQGLWQPLLQAARVRGDIGLDIAEQFSWEAFLVRDANVNAFALPGGAIGIHLGLIAITQSRDELASVLAHELSHITQRHIARSIGVGQRSSLVGLAALILGLLAASRSGNVDVANAAIYGSQAVAAQTQLNFSRDMEREADRNGFALLLLSGYSGMGMSRMFERLDISSRLNDNGSYPYLRSHPLTTERIGEARQLAATRAGGADVTGSVFEHALMQARARVLMDPSAQALRRYQLDDEAALPDPVDVSGVTLLYAAALASLRLNEPARAERAWARAQTALAASGQDAARLPRLWRYLAVELALAQRDIPRALALVEPAGADGSRAGLLLMAQVALAAGPQRPQLRHSVEQLQTWLVEHRADAGAWSALAQCARVQGLALRAVRAEAEAQAALGDLGGAIDRLRGAQEGVRRGGQTDFIEASVIDARLRELQAQRRELMAELRRGNRPARPDEPH